MSAKGHKKNKGQGHAPNHERWVISYADLLTLLLATFVVLYASSVRSKLKEEQVAQAFIKAFHGSPSSVVVTKPSGSQGVLQNNVSPIPRNAVAPGSRMPQPSPQSHKLEQQINKDMVNLRQLSLRLQQMFQPEISKQQIAMNNTPLTLSISLNDSVLFASGQTTLKPEAQILLTNIAGGLTGLPDGYRIVVRGYTDDQPISTPQFPSNWSLSAERAVSVVQLFLKAGLPGDILGAEGFGQYDPIASNDTDQGRYLNRRVVIVVQAPSPVDAEREATSAYENSAKNLPAPAPLPAASPASSPASPAPATATAAPTLSPVAPSSSVSSPASPSPSGSAGSKS